MEYSKEDMDIQILFQNRGKHEGENESLPVKIVPVAEVEELEVLRKKVKCINPKSASLAVGATGLVLAVFGVIGMVPAFAMIGISTTVCIVLDIPMGL